MQTEVQRLYDVVWYPSASGQITKREIRTAGGESGVALLQKIREALKADGELITADNASSKEVLYGSAKLFFADGDVVSLAKLRSNFACLRHWPVLEKADLLEMLVRVGVEHNIWCLFRMGDADSDRPTEIHHRDKGQVPININLSDAGWLLVTIQGATKRGWIGSTLDPKKVQQWVYDIVREQGAATSKGVAEQVVAQYGEVPEGAVYEALGKVVQEGKLMAFSGQPEQAQKPADLVTGGGAVMLHIQPDQALITRAKAAEKGWVGSAAPDKGIKLTEAEVKAKVLPNLRTLGSLYQRGAKSAIDTLDIWDMEVAGGGRMRIALTDLTPESMKRLQEFFETVALVAKPGSDTGGELEIRHPEEECLLVQTLKGNQA